MMMTTPAILLRSGRFSASELAGSGGRGAENDEHRSEAEHKGDRRQHHRGVDVGRRLILAGELIEGGAAKEAEIRRHERQHARAEEAQEPRDQRAEIGDVHGSCDCRRSKSARAGTNS